MSFDKWIKTQSMKTKLTPVDRSKLPTWHSSIALYARGQQRGINRSTRFPTFFRDSNKVCRLVCKSNEYLNGMKLSDW
jgi:hypothetical protein